MNLSQHCDQKSVWYNPKCFWVVKYSWYELVCSHTRPEKTVFGPVGLDYCLEVRDWLNNHQQG